MNQIKLFSGSSTRYLSELISDHFGHPLADYTLSKFSDGEMRPIFNESVRGTHTFLIQSTFAPAENLLELLLMIDCAKRASADYIAAVIPYFGYARQDRKDKPRVPISAKVIADMLVAAGAHRIMTMDFHADQLQGFFNIPVDHIQSDAIFIPYLQENVDLSSAVFASPDVGGVKRARKYAMYFDKDLVICDKYRKVANKVEKITVIGDVKDRDVILVDDLVDTAGTMCRAADELIKQGAKSVRAICTHAVLSGKAYENIEASQMLELIVTDTIPLRAKSSKIKVESVSKLFCHAMRNTYENRSLSALFLD